MKSQITIFKEKYKNKSSVKFYRNHPNRHNFNPLINKLLHSSKKYCRTYAINLIKNNKQYDKSYHCFYCNTEINKLNFSIDHYIPRSKGGDLYHINNLRLSCKECNSIKSSINPITAKDILKFAFKNKHYRISLFLILKTKNETLIDHWNIFNINIKYLIFIKIYFTSFFIKKDTYKNFLNEHLWHDFNGHLNKPLEEDKFGIVKKIITLNQL